MIAFKRTRLAYEWHLIDPKLRLMIDWIINKKAWPGDMVVTSVYRDPSEQASVNPSMVGKSAHGTLPIRANDLRTRDFSAEEVKKAVARINKTWLYDFKREHLKCAVLEHNHVHLQVHSNTSFESDA